MRSAKVAKDVLTDVRLGRAVNVRKVKRAARLHVPWHLNRNKAPLG